MPRQIAVYELNEVPWRVIDWYRARHPASEVAQLVNLGRSYETVAADDGPLSPWITWPTVHRGVSNQVHQISALGQSVADIDREHPPIWRLLADHGVSVGVFGSLHTAPLPADASRYAFYVPDTFAATPETHPPSLEVFQRFNLAMVDRNGANVTRGLPLGDAARMAARFLPLGGRLASVARVAAQLLDERLHPAHIVRRRTMQSVLAFDLYLHQLREKAPRFSACFTNHVASAMHRYWPATFPQDYSQTPFEPDWIARYAHEIAFAMDVASAQIGQLARWVDAQHDAMLVVMSSMGQAAVDDGHVPLRTQLFLKAPEKLMRALGIPDGAWARQRTMEPDYTFSFTQGYEARFEAALRATRINGQPPKVNGLPEATVAVSFGQRNLDDATTHIEVEGRTYPLSDLGLRNTVKQDEADSNAYHVPQGILMVYEGPRGARDGTRAQRSTLDVAPSLMAALGVEPPAYMQPAQPL